MKIMIKKVFLSIILAVCIMITGTVSVCAMNFEFEVAAQSVFIIESYGSFGIGAMGSGFAVDEHHIVTNAHVIENKNDITITSYSETAEDNRGDTYPASLVSVDSNIDIAILYVEEVTLIPLKLADANTIKEGDDVYAIGTPEELAYTLTKGTVSSKLRVTNGVKYVQTDAGITHGNSGGPLLNDNGEVIGMNTSGSSTSESIRFAIRVDEISEYINKYIDFDNLEEGSTDASVNDDTVSSEGAEDVSETESEIIDSSDISSESKNTVADTSDSQDVGDTNDGGTDYYYIPVGLIAMLTIGVICAIIGISLKPKQNHDLMEVPIIKVEKPENKAKESEVENAEDFIGVCIMSGTMTGAEFKLGNEKTAILGKDPKLSNIVFDNTYSMVSRMHCSISYSAKFNKYFVIDNSSNGTYFEGGKQRLIKNTRTPVPRGTILLLADSDCKILLK